MGKAGSRIAYTSSDSSSSINSRWVCWHPQVPVSVRITIPQRIYCFWEPWGRVLSTILGNISSVTFFSCISFPISVQVSGRTCPRLIQAFNSNCSLLDGRYWLLTVLTMLEDISHLCPIVKDLIRDVSVGWRLKRVCNLHFTLWLHRDMYCTDKGSLSQSAGQWWEWLKHLQQSFIRNVGKNGQVIVLEWVYQTMPLLPISYLIVSSIYLGLD